MVCKLFFQNPSLCVFRFRLQCIHAGQKQPIKPEQAHSYGEPCFVAALLLRLSNTVLDQAVAIILCKGVVESVLVRDLLRSWSNRNGGIACKQPLHKSANYSKNGCNLSLSATTKHFNVGFRPLLPPTLALSFAACKCTSLWTTATPNPLMMPESNPPDDA